MSIATNFTMWRGEDKVFTFTMTPTTDITGWTLSFAMAPGAAGVPPALTKAGAITAPAANGVFTVTLASADTAGLTPGTYYFDVRRTNAGSKTTLANGTITLSQEVAA